MPVGEKANIRLLRHGRVASRTRVRFGSPHFPPTLAEMIMLMVDHKPRVPHHRPDPPDAMIAVVGVVLEMVPQQEAFRGTIRNIDTKNFRATGNRESQL